MKRNTTQWTTTFAIGLTALSFSTLADAASTTAWKSLSKKPALFSKAFTPITAREFVGSVDGYQVYRELSTSNLKTAKLIFISKDGTSEETTIDASIAVTIKDGVVTGSIPGEETESIFSIKDGVIISPKMGGGGPTPTITETGDEFMGGGGPTPTFTDGNTLLKVSNPMPGGGGPTPTIK